MMITHPPAAAHVTPVTPAASLQAAPSIPLSIARRPRPKYLRPCLSPDPRKRLAQLHELIAQAEQDLQEAA